MRYPHWETAKYSILCVLLGAAGCSDQHASGDSAESSAGNGAPARTGLAFVPDFPGAGGSGADEPLPGGKVCDSRSRVDRKLTIPKTDCFFQPGRTQPSATIEQVLECVDGVDAVHLRLTFDPAFVDNSYGENAIGWETRGKAGPGAPPAMPGGLAKAPMAPMAGPGGMGMAPPPPPAAMGGKAGMGPGGKAGHTWKDLVGSDHAEFVVKDEAGDLALQFKLDYISVSDDEPSGYASLGVLGGDGKMISGDAAAVVKWRTSIERNLNERGYGEYIVDSPATDADYTPNAATPNWDYRVVYEAWVDHAAFGDSGFGGALIEHVHASPSKFPKDTIEVVPGECPPCMMDGSGCGETPLTCELEPDHPDCQLL